MDDTHRALEEVKRLTELTLSTWGGGRREVFATVLSLETTRRVVGQGCPLSSAVEWSTAVHVLYVLFDASAWYRLQD